MFRLEKQLITSPLIQYNDRRGDLNATSVAPHSNPRPECYEKLRRLRAFTYDLIN